LTTLPRRRARLDEQVRAVKVTPYDLVHDDPPPSAAVGDRAGAFAAPDEQERQM